MHKSASQRWVDILQSNLLHSVKSFGGKTLLKGFSSHLQSLEIGDMTRTLTQSLSPGQIMTQMYVIPPICLAVKDARLATGLGKTTAADLHFKEVSDVTLYICIAAEDRPSAAI